MKRWTTIPRRRNSSMKGADSDSMTFWEHLEVLRMSLFRVGAVLLAAFMLCLVFMPKVFDVFFLGPTDSSFFLYKWFAELGSLAFTPNFSDGGFHVEIININVASQFMTHMSSAFWTALVIACPFILYELWRFVEPALYPVERKEVGTAFGLGTLMFYLGCAVGYCVVFPLTFRFLAQYTLGSQIVNQINLKSYMNMFLTMIFVMGLVFELPLLAWVLSKLGIIDKTLLRKYRKYAVVVLLILAAVITPSGDPFTLLVVFLPLYLLYELSIAMIR